MVLYTKLENQSIFAVQIHASTFAFRWHRINATCSQVLNGITVHISIQVVLNTYSILFSSLAMSRFSLVVLAVSIASVAALLGPPSRRTRQCQSTCSPFVNRMSSNLEVSNFIDESIAKKIADSHSTPVYVYSEKVLKGQAAKALDFPNLYGLKVRFAMKACPNAAVLKLFHSMGLNFDASSGYEVERAVRANISPSEISLSSQELPHNFEALIKMGLEFNACSLNQLETFGKLFPGGSCGIRFNPGKGSGGTGKTNVGGPSSSFGIWHEQKEVVKDIAAKYGLKIVRIHTHIGSGSDPAIWQSVAVSSLNLVREFPDVCTLNLGGGYKVGRMSYEVSTDLQKIGIPVKEAFEAFANEDGRKLKLEIEPGTFLVANAGAVLCTVRDIVSTGPSGNTFIKLDSGMTEVLRPSLYGAQHPIVVHKDTDAAEDYIVVGHCCESGDLFSCAPGEAEVLQPRRLKKAEIGDLVTIEGAGAYCASMSTKNYNSFPEAAEVLLDEQGEVHLIRRRQNLDQILANEVSYTPAKK